MDTIFSREFDSKLRYELKDYKKGEMLPAVSDVMFRVMFNNESKKQYAAYFLSLVLNREYDEIYNSIKFEKTELDKDNYHASKETVDLVCTLDGIIHNIEMNNNPNVETLERNISYVLGLYSGSMHRGNSYNYNYVIQVNLNNFNFEGNNRVIDEIYLKTIDNIVLTDKIKFINIFLPLIRNKLYNKGKLSTLEKLLLIFNEKDSKELEKLYKGDKIMEEYRTDAYNSSQKKEILGLYDREKEQERILKARLYNTEQAGIEKGISQAKNEAAINLIKNGVSLDIISKSLGMDIKELEKLQ